MAARTRLSNRLSAQLYAERIVVGVEDMVLLSDITDNGIVENLTSRLKASEIYTYIGSVLVVCNPYKWLPIYGHDYVVKYPFRMQTDTSPHIFFTAESAYRSMILEEENQCIIISGESGAGKTETSKQIQNYIAAVCGGGEGVDKLKEVFINSNPVLEAFGNAKTLRNNNSSRFGKYFELKFDKAGRPKGGVITNYLLEKSRIVRPGQGERGFHIFYQLIASKYRNTFGLGQGPSAFSYLSCSECYTIDGIDDVSEYNNTVAALKSVGIQPSEVQTVMTVVAAILHLGNIRFTPDAIPGGAEGSKIVDFAGLNDFCQLMQLDPTAVAYVLTHRDIQTTRGGKVESTSSPQNPVQASSRRDSIARSLYEKLFNLIVATINTSLDPESGSVYAVDLSSVGVLDIYGFEIFEKNGFEQLCINYVNEKLQQIFIELTLRAEQDEYEREGIQWTPIPFFNNRIVCDLLDGSQPPGFFRVLDDVCKTMHAVQASVELDLSLVQKCSGIHSANRHFQAVKGGFVIKHYAGEVSYQVGKFGETNKDCLNADLVGLLKTAGEPLVSQLLYGDDDLNDQKAVTGSCRLRTQCQSLVEALMECQPHYVRCVKSNDGKKALFIEKPRVIHQVKYLGLSENIKVRRAGFAYRCEFGRFLDRFDLLSPLTYPDWKGSDGDGCHAIINTVKKSIACLNKPGEVQFGKSMIFIRTPEAYFNIIKVREKRINDAPIPIQRAWRKFMSTSEVDKLPATMTDLYLSQNKARNRSSFYRTYSGSYLDSLGPAQAEKVKEGIYRIIDFYSTSEGVIFVDQDARQIVRSATTPFYVEEPRILVLTDGAIYLMQILDKNSRTKYHPKKELPDILLRRRIAIETTDPEFPGLLESLQLSTLADGLLFLRMKRIERIVDPKTFEHPKWPKKDAVKRCQLTGRLFSTFEWKKRCKASGLVLCNLVCDIKQAIPDYGYYEPDRVADSSFGLMSCDQIEDVLIASLRKTEFVGLLSIEWDRKRSRSNNRKLIEFCPLNMFPLKSGPNKATSRVPASEVRLQAHTAIDDLNLRGDMIDYPTNEVLQFQVAAGISIKVVEARRKRLEASRRKAEIRRKQADEERRIRNIDRDTEREKAKQEKLEEKRQANAAKKAGNLAKLSSSKVALTSAQSRSMPVAISKLGGTIPSTFQTDALNFTRPTNPFGAGSHSPLPSAQIDQRERAEAFQRGEILSARFSFENVYNKDLYTIVHSDGPPLNGKVLPSSPLLAQQRPVADTNFSTANSAPSVSPLVNSNSQTGMKVAKPPKPSKVITNSTPQLDDGVQNSPFNSNQSNFKMESISEFSPLLQSEATPSPRPDPSAESIGSFPSSPTPTVMASTNVSANTSFQASIPKPMPKSPPPRPSMPTSPPPRPPTNGLATGPPATAAPRPRVGPPSTPPPTPPMISNPAASPKPPPSRPPPPPPSHPSPQQQQHQRSIEQNQFQSNSRPGSLTGRPPPPPMRSSFEQLGKESIVEVPQQTPKSRSSLVQPLPRLSESVVAEPFRASVMDPNPQTIVRGSISHPLTKATTRASIADSSQTSVGNLPARVSTRLSWVESSRRSMAGLSLKESTRTSVDVPNRESIVSPPPKVASSGPESPCLESVVEPFLKEATTRESVIGLSRLSVKPPPKVMNPASLSEGESMEEPSLKEANAAQPGQQPIKEPPPKVVTPALVSDFRRESMVEPSLAEALAPQPSRLSIVEPPPQVMTAASVSERESMMGLSLKEVYAAQPSRRSIVEPPPKVVTLASLLERESMVVPSLKETYAAQPGRLSIVEPPPKVMTPASQTERESMVGFKEAYEAQPSRPLMAEPPPKVVTHAFLTERESMVGESLKEAYAAQPDRQSIVEPPPKVVTPVTPASVSERESMVMPSLKEACAAQPGRQSIVKPPPKVITAGSLEKPSRESMIGPSQYETTKASTIGASRESMVNTSIVLTPASVSEPSRESEVELIPSISIQSSSSVPPRASVPRAPVLDSNRRNSSAAPARKSSSAKTVPVLTQVLDFSVAAPKKPSYTPPPKPAFVAPPRPVRPGAGAPATVATSASIAAPSPVQPKPPAPPQRPLQSAPVATDSGPIALIRSSLIHRPDEDYNDDNGVEIDREWEEE